MRHGWTAAAAAFLVSVNSASLALACEGTRLPALVAASSLGKLAAEIDANGISSSEGAGWQVYNGTQSGKPVNIVLTVYGEMGREEQRLVIAGPTAYAVLATTYRYSAPITDPDMKARVTARSTYTFCDGKVQRPAAMSDAKYAAHRKAAAAAKSAFRASEIRSYVKGVKL